MSCYVGEATEGLEMSCEVSEVPVMYLKQQKG